MSERLLSTTVPLYLSKPLVDKIKYLCTVIHEVEWSGILILNTEGGLEDLENMSLEAIDVFPMNKGTSSYTEYDFDEEVLDIYDEHPEYLGTTKLSHIHSHNHMSVFFSGTDTQELYDNAPNHNYYISLIVNNKFDTQAKLAFVSEETQKINIISSFKGSLNKIFSWNSVEEKIVKTLNIVNLEIIKPVEEDTIEQFFKDRVDTICKKAEEKTFASRLNAPYTPSNYKQGTLWNQHHGQYGEYQNRFNSYEQDNQNEYFTSKLVVENYLTYLLTEGKLDNVGTVSIEKRAEMADFRIKDFDKYTSFVGRSLEVAFKIIVKNNKITFEEFLEDLSTYLDSMSMYACPQSLLIVSNVIDAEIEHLELNL